MRKLIIISSIILTVFIAACNDDIQPFGESNEKYILNCVIKSDTNFQVLTLAKSYPATSYNPYDNTTDPSIKGAVIRLWEGNDKVTFFRDTIIARDSASLYKTPYSLYFAKGIQPESNTVLDIEAILPSGKKLTASGITPLKPRFLKQGQGGDGDSIVPPPANTSVLFRWGLNAAPRGTVYVPRIYIAYKVPVNGKLVRKMKLVPKGYFMFNGQEYPEHFGLSNSPLAYISMQTIDRSMREISEGDPDKSKYIIYSIVADVVSLDQNLSAYYNATNKNKDPFAVKLYETDYSNITGGFGVFGISYLAGTLIDISYNYVKSFGYNHGYKNH
jgi:hypothetical protein